jgi:WD40 repeat protein
MSTVDAALAELNASVRVAPVRAVALLRAHAFDERVVVAATTALAAAADTGEGSERLEYSAGRRACVEADAPSALVALARSALVHSNVDAARLVASAIHNLARAKEGAAALVDAGAACALVELAGAAAARARADAMQWVARALNSLCFTAAGHAALLTAGVAPAYAALAREPAVAADEDAAMWVAIALCNFCSEGEGGQAALLAVGAASALVALSGAAAVRARAETANWVARAVGDLSDGDTGGAALADAGAAHALVALARAPAVAGDADAAESVARAVAKLCESDKGRAALLATDADAALRALADARAVRGSERAARAVANAARALVEAAADAAREAVAEREAARAAAAAARTAALVAQYAAASSAADRGLPFCAFLSHAQATAGDEALVLREALASLGARAWYDQDNEPTLEGMRRGVASAGVFVLVLSAGALARTAVRLEARAALEREKPIVYVLVPAEGDANAHEDAAAAAAILRDGRAQQEEALARAGADATAAERVRALTDAQWAALEARLEVLPPIVFRRDAARLWAETLPPLAAALGRSGVGAAPAAPEAAPFRMRGVLAAADACDALIVAAAAGATQAIFLQLALQHRCARRELVLRQLPRETGQNRAGVPMVSSTGPRASGLAYCGRRLGVEAIPGSDGQCGPNDGPQCADCACSGQTAEEAVAGAARVVVLMTERFFDDHAVAAALRAALRLERPIVLVWEHDYRHGGLERFDFFIGGREEVRDVDGGIRVAAVPPTPDDLLALYEGTVAQPFERRAEKRELMLEALLERQGAVRADALGGRLPPPPLPAAFNAEPVQASVDEIARMLLDGQHGIAGDNASPVAIPLLPCRIVATGGLGGAGKTTLATAVVRTRIDVRAAFDDVFWVTLGKASRAQLLGKMRELIAELAEGDTGEEATVEAATKRLRKLLSARKALVVVDDAWTQDHFSAFIGAVEAPTSVTRAGSSRGAALSRASSAVAAAPASGASALLFTTRNLSVFRHVAEPAAMRALPVMAWKRLGHFAAFAATELAPSPARVFLAAAAGIPSARAAALDFSRVFGAVGTSPLALSVVGACARTQLEPLRQPDDEAEHVVVDGLAAQLDSGGVACNDADETACGADVPAHGAWLESPRFVAALRTQNREEGKSDAVNAAAFAQYLPTFRAIALSLSTLFGESNALSFAALGLFPDDTSIHERVVAAAWRMERAPARALLERLQGAGLAKLEVAEGGEVGAVAVMLHDLARDFAAALCDVQAGGAARLHCHFLARLAQELPAREGACRPWWRLGDTTIAAFAAEHLLFHMRTAALDDEAAALVFRLPFLQFALRRRGALALTADIDHNVPRREDTDLLLETLRLSRSGLLEGDADADETADSLLPGQIVARISVELASQWRATLGALREECSSWRGPRAWIQLVNAGLESPGGPLKATLDGHTEYVTAAVTLSCGRVVSGSRDHTLRVWDMVTNACERVLEGHTGSVWCLAVLADGRVVSGSKDGTLRVWDVTTGICELVLEGHAHRTLSRGVRSDGRIDANDVRCLTVLPVGRRSIVVSGSDDHTLLAWDTATGECVVTFAGHTGAVWCVNAVAGTLVSGSSDKSLRAWNVETGTCERVFEGHNRLVRCVAALADGRIVSGSDDKTVRVWRLATGACEHVLEGHTEWARCVCALPGGLIMSASDDCTLRVWSAATGACERTLKGHTGAVYALTALPDGRALSGSYDKTLRVWDAASGACCCVLEGHTSAVLCATVLDNGRVVSASDDRTLRVWDISRDTREHAYSGHAGYVRCLLALENGRVVSGSDDKTLRVWDAVTGACLYTAAGHALGVSSVAALANGRFVSASYDNTLRVWNASSGNCERIVQQADEDYAALDPSATDTVTAATAAVSLRHSGQTLLTSAARIHLGAVVGSSAAYDEPGCGVVLAAGTASGLVLFARIMPALHFHAIAPVCASATANDGVSGGGGGIGSIGGGGGSISGGGGGGIGSSGGGAIGSFGNGSGGGSGGGSPFVSNKPTSPASTPKAAAPSPALSTAKAWAAAAEKMSDAISIGAWAYNAGDLAKCRDAYTSTAKALMAPGAPLAAGSAPALVAQRAALLAALAKAEGGESANDGAWTMRHAFDAFLEKADGAAKSAEMEDKIAVALAAVQADSTSGVGLTAERAVELLSTYAADRPVAVAAAKIVFLASAASVREHVDAARGVARALVDLIDRGEGNAACVAAGAAPALVALADAAAVKGDAEAAAHVAHAIAKLALSDDGEDALLAADAARAITALAAEPAVRRSAPAARHVAAAMLYVGWNAAGQERLLGLGGAAALAALAGEAVVAADADAARQVASASVKLASGAAGRAALLAAGAVRPLVALARGAPALASAETARAVAQALATIGAGADGGAALVAAEAALALVGLARAAAVAADASAAQHVAAALARVGRAGAAGAAALLAGGAAPALVALSLEAAVRDDADATEAVAAALDALGADDAGAAALLASGAAPALVAIFEKAAAEDAAAESVALALVTLAATAPGRTALVAAGCAPALVAPVRVAASSSRTARAAARAMAAFAGGDEGGRAALVAAGAVAALVAFAGLVVKALATHAHALTEVAAPAPARAGRCDLCRASLERARAFACRPCNYDECADCASGAALPAIARAATALGAGADGRAALLSSGAAPTLAAVAALAAGRRNVGAALWAARALAGVADACPAEEVAPALVALVVFASGPAFAPHAHAIVRGGAATDARVCNLCRERVGRADAWSCTPCAHDECADCAARVALPAIARAAAALGARADGRAALLSSGAAMALDALACAAATTGSADAVQEVARAVECLSETALVRS